MHTIEKANSKDIPELIKLLNYLFSQEADFTPNAKHQEQALQLIINDQNIGQILVLKEDRKIIGMVNLLFTISTALGDKVAILEDMVVHPDRRGKGLGSKLLNGAVDFAKKSGLKRITLLTDANNFDAHKFYEKYGFEKSAMIPFRVLINEEMKE